VKHYWRGRLNEWNREMALITLRSAILLHELSGFVTRVHIHAATTKGLACPVILGARDVSRNLTLGIQILSNTKFKGEKLKMVHAVMEIKVNIGHYSNHILEG
jgi:hypothetical protein